MPTLLAHGRGLYHTDWFGLMVWATFILIPVLALVTQRILFHQRVHKYVDSLHGEAVTFEHQLKMEREGYDIEFIVNVICEDNNRRRRVK